MPLLWGSILPIISQKPLQSTTSQTASPNQIPTTTATTKYVNALSIHRLIRAMDPT